MFWNMAFDSTDSYGALAKAEYDRLQTLPIADFYDLLANSQRYAHARNKRSGAVGIEDEWG